MEETKCQYGNELLIRMNFTIVRWPEHLLHALGLQRLAC
jgi:hypothetical protein